MKYRNLIKILLYLSMIKDFKTLGKILIYSTKMLCKNKNFNFIKIRKLNIWSEWPKEKRGV